MTEESTMDQALNEYVAAMPDDYRPLFDRIGRLVLDTFPEATMGLSYKMPAYRVGKHRLYIGVWNHGLSIYGWAPGGADGFIARHPHLRTSKGTIRLGIDDADGITDDELRELVRAALDR
jgi:uncharacterized protein YdhG (YjbR/CyaY superfamily)